MGRGPERGQRTERETVTHKMQQRDSEKEMQRRKLKWGFQKVFEEGKGLEKGKCGNIET